MDCLVFGRGFEIPRLRGITFGRFGMALGRWNDAVAVGMTVEGEGMRAFESEQALADPAVPIA